VRNGIYSSEKRDFIRMKLGAPLHVTLTYQDQTLVGECLDLSGGGLQIRSPQSLPITAELMATLASEHGHKPTLRASTRVARCEQDNNGYLIGLEILEIIE
jgi:hypothetical protein